MSDGFLRIGQSADHGVRPAIHVLAWTGAGVLRVDTNDASASLALSATSPSLQRLERRPFSPSLVASGFCAMNKCTVAPSCKAIKTADPMAKDGIFNIDPDGNGGKPAFDVRCEMTLDGGPRSASVMTLESTTCVVVTGANVRDFLGTHPDFALHLIRKLIALVRRSTDTVKRLALDDVYTRIYKLLYELAQDDESGRQVVAERLTQQDIADRVGSSREMVSRIFKQLTIGGYVASEGKRIVLLKKLPARW